jgi:hypothetical protein
MATTVRLVATMVSRHTLTAFEDSGSRPWVVSRFRYGNTNALKRVDVTRALFNMKKTTKLFCYEETGDNILLMPPGVINLQSFPTRL